LGFEKKCLKAKLAVLKFELHIYFRFWVNPNTISHWGVWPGQAQVGRAEEGNQLKKKICPFANFVM